MSETPPKKTKQEHMREVGRTSKAGGRPKKEESLVRKEQELVNRIRRAEKGRLEKNVEWLEDLNKTMPIIMEKIAMFANGNTEITLNEIRACQWLYDKWTEMSAQMSKSADQIEETYSTKDKIVGKEDNVTRVTFTKEAVPVQ